MKLFKIIASKAGAIVFDDRLEAETPREAREKMKQALNIESLTGYVYAITEIPLDLIREIVTNQMAAVTTTRRGTTSLDIQKLVGEAVNAITGTALGVIQQRMAKLEQEKPAGRFNPLATSRYRTFNDEQLPESIGDDGTIAIPAAKRRAEIRPIPAPIRAVLGPDWKAIRRRYRRDRSVKQTAAEFNVPINTLKGRIQREGWAK